LRPCGVYDRRLRLISHLPIKPQGGKALDNLTQQAQFKVAKFKVARLAIVQALSMTSMTILFTVAALIGMRLAPDKTGSTLPIALLQLTVMFTTLPASWLMQRYGRRLGFVVGTIVGLVGAAVGIVAVGRSHFLGFCAAMVLLGVFNGVIGFYRFAAAEVAEPEFRPQAISLVLAGGVVAALAGPTLANAAQTWRPLQDWLSALLGLDYFVAPNGWPLQFASSLVPIVVLQLAALGVLATISMPPLPVEARMGGRSLGTIVQQPVFLIALAGSVIGYAVMVFIMTATPLAIVGLNHPFHEAATVLQWHVLGMFAPSFVTGTLIARFGVLRIMLCGIVLNLLCVAINAMGMDLWHFRSALLLLGIGWNFLFIGSTTLLTEAYRPEEKAKTQATHDFLMYSFVALATYRSGPMQTVYGWQAVNYAAIPGLIAVLVAVLWYGRKHRALTER
jgi:MFS family permease